MIPEIKARLHRLQRPLRYARLAELLAHQARGREYMAQKQLRDRDAIVAYAWEHTPFYRDHFGPGWRPETPFAELPILRKDQVIARLPEMLSDEADRAAAHIGHTGGSTGQPLAFWYDEAKHELMRAGMMRSYMGSGWRPGQKILNFWGARQDTASGGVFGAGWGDFIAAETTIPAHEFSEEKLAAWARFIQDWRPVLLQGYASILAELARFILAAKLTMPRSLIGVYSTAEVLDGWQRELMAQAFGCKVFNQYGSREVPNMACECRQGNMHLFTDMVYLESRPVDGEDRLLVTSLTNRLMPFIRYDIGDAGRLSGKTCACGWPFPLMEMGMCRQNDLIRAPGGKTVHPSFFNRMLYGRTEIGQYQFVQETEARIVLSVVSDVPPDSAFVADMERTLRTELGPDMVLEVRQVTDIPRTRSGKHRFVIGLPR